MPEKTEINSHNLGSIKGQITLEGKPVSSLRLDLFSKEGYVRWYERIATTRTDETGRYRFTEVSTGYYWINVAEPTYVNASNWNAEGAGRDVAVADGDAVRNADLDLIIGGVVAGRIIDSDGNPVVDEYVELSFYNEYGRYCEDALGFYDNEDEFRTDENGSYRIYGIPPGRYFISIGVDIAKLTGATRDS